MLSNILNLRAYNILGSTESEHDYHIKAETGAPLTVCSNCHSREVVGYGRVEVLVRDLPMHGKRVGICVGARRFKCKSCGKNLNTQDFTQTLFYNYLVLYLIDFY